jgi:hypothetical protein
MDKAQAIGSSRHGSDAQPRPDDAVGETPVAFVQCLETSFPSATDHAQDRQTCALPTPCVKTGRTGQCRADILEAFVKLGRCLDLLETRSGLDSLCETVFRWNAAA